MTRRRRRNTVTLPAAKLPRDWRELGLDHPERDEALGLEAAGAYMEQFAPNSVEVMLIDFLQLEEGLIDVKCLSNADVEACPRGGPPMPSHFRRDGSCRCDEHHAAVRELAGIELALGEVRAELRLLRSHIELIKDNLARINECEETERELVVARLVAEEWVSQT